MKNESQRPFSDVEVDEDDGDGSPSGFVSRSRGVGDDEHGRGGSTGSLDAGSVKKDEGTDDVAVASWHVGRCVVRALDPDPVPL